ncbi:MAG: carboxypeptidase regulatory-like domain-containing protein [Gemmatimonadaceae bacterium]|nr:carboxypeptidase regulatory-like domain-containing protein [Gemmatimonadaceae bacterium]
MSLLSSSPRTTLVRLACTVLAMLAGPLTAPLAAQTPTVTPAPAAAPAQTGARGFVAGTVIDKDSGRPLESANIILLNTTLRTQTDLDGRFRIAAPAGVYSVRAFRLGNAPAQIDSVRIVAGGTATANFALGSVAVTLGAVAVTAGPVRANNEDALLAMQKAAPRVSDGISSQAIARAPGSSASDAIVRVTGVSIVDNKFAVVRGLSERYSNTLLNGVELPSPEPLKKIVPLDLFPSSLLESIVVSKTATPDRPGDFAGGSVEVSTKEFPDQRVAEGNLNVGYGSQSTFRELPYVRQRGIDYLGFDQGGVRQMPGGIPTTADGSQPFSPRNEVFAERLRNVWTPAPTRVDPNLGGGMNLGGRFGEKVPVGYAVSLTLNRQIDATPNRLSQLVFDAATGLPDQGYTSNEATTTVDLGAIANFAVRLGTTQKLGIKNLYTRNAEERISRTAGYETYNGNAERLIYQSRYITRVLTQTQLTGDHLIQPLLGSRFEWKATLAVAQRDEPENRSLIYFKTPTQAAFQLSPSNPSPLWFRFLEDRVRSFQGDWNLPLSWVLPDGSQFKAGALYRERDRTFDAFFFRAFPTTDPVAAPTLALPPERAFSGEMIGTALDVRRQGAFTVPYESDDDIRAYYAMLDLPITPWLRLVGGLRRESWKLNMYNGTKLAPLAEPNFKRTTDDLLSGNLTINVTDRQNLRLAVYQTVARPDPREVSADYYVAITGDCANQGNPLLNRSRILNADARWEYYPNAGELVSASLFYKDFADPIGELLSYEGSSLCTTQYRNFESSVLTGAEIEFRKGLTFLPGPLARLALGVNLTLVQSNTVYRLDSTRTLEYRLQGQSDRLANVNLLYADPDIGLDASVLFNYFTDRIVRYGNTTVTGTGDILQVPGVIEQGRVSLDAKIRRKVGNATWSLSGRNLTDNEVIFFQPHDAGRTRTGYLRPGIQVSIGVGYAIR